MIAGDQPDATLIDEESSSASRITRIHMVEQTGHQESALTHVVTKMAGFAASMFQHIEVRGGPVPDGPVMVVVNHQNALLDPLVVFRVAGRSTRPLAKAPLFDQLLLGSVLKGLGGLPVHRRQDGPAQMHKNEDTFRAAIDALHAGDALQIYPEGRSHSELSMEPLRTGAVRIALAAEAERGGKLGLLIVPIGLTWEKKHLFGGQVLADIGEPFGVEPWLMLVGADDADSVRSLTDEIAGRLGRRTLNLSSAADLELLSAADRIYSREKALHGYRERDLMADRVPRLRRFARGLEWLRARDPEKYEGLARKVYRVDGVSRALGANAFLTRLTGHGRTGEALGDAVANDWLADAAEALEVGVRLGRRVVLIGVSTGGTLATWAAAQSERRDDIAALVLISPNYGVRDSRAWILTLPWGAQLTRMIQGEEYSFETANDLHLRYWTERYPTKVLSEMAALTQLIDDDLVSRIQVPTLVFLSPDDRVIDPLIVETAFGKFGAFDKELIQVTEVEDPSNHVFAGEILSPGATAPRAARILEFVQRVVE